MTWGLVALFFLAEPPPAAQIKIDAIPRSGYALVTVSSPTDKPVKQVVFVTSTTSPNDVTFDQTSPTTGVVTLPTSGVVTVHAVALLSSNELAPPAIVDIHPNPVTRTAKETSTPLRVTLVIDQQRMSPAEVALGNSKAIKGALTKAGGRFLYADFYSPNFQAVLNAARATLPSLPTQPPFLLIQTMDQKALAAYKLSLTSDFAQNETAVLSILQNKELLP